MTTRGGAGEVFSETGDRRGVVGSPFACAPPALDPWPWAESELSESGEGFDVAGFRLVIGELGAGDDGPGEEEEEVVMEGVDLDPEGDLDLASPDLVRVRFCVSVDSPGHTQTRGWRGRVLVRECRGRVAPF